MTLRALADIIIYTGAVMTALMAIGAVLHVVVVKPLRSSLNKELKDVKTVSDKVLNEVAPPNGLSMNDRLSKVELGMNNLDQRMSDHIMTHRSL